MVAPLRRVVDASVHYILEMTYAVLRSIVNKSVLAISVASFSGIITARQGTGLLGFSALKGS